MSTFEVRAQPVLPPEMGPGGQEAPPRPPPTANVYPGFHQTGAPNATDIVQQQQQQIEMLQRQMQQMQQQQQQQQPQQSIPPTQAPPEAQVFAFASADNAPFDMQAQQQPQPAPVMYTGPPPLGTAVVNVDGPAMFNVNSPEVFDVDGPVGQQFSNRQRKKLRQMAADLKAAEKTGNSGTIEKRRAQFLDSAVTFQKQRQEQMEQERQAEQRKQAQAQHNSGLRRNGNNNNGNNNNPQRPTGDLPDGLVLDSPSRGVDTISPPNASRVGLIIGGCICILTGVIITTVFYFSGMFKDTPVTALGPIVTIVVGIVLIACIRMARITVDRNQMTFRAESWFFLAPCAKCPVTYDLSCVEEVRTEVSCVRINKQTMSNISFKCGAESIGLGMVPMWGSDGVRRQWQAYFDWAKRPQ